jgi:hypothetical protein
VRTTALLLFILLIPLAGKSQIYRYDVVKGDKSIGELEVIRRTSGEQEFVNIKSDVEFRILFSFRVIYGLEEKFDKGVLQAGSGFNTLNGSYQKQTKIAKSTDGYKLEIDGVEVNLPDREITYTVSRIYYQEPEDGERTYSQTFGKWLTFEQVSDHRYKLPSPDGDNYYTYTNGVCTFVEVNRDYGDVTFEMKPESLARVKEDK